MAQEPDSLSLSPQQHTWLTDFCRANELSCEIGETCFGVEFTTDDVSAGIYPLPNDGLMLLTAEVMEFTDIDAMENPLLLMLLHRLNGLNQAESDHVVTMDDNVLTVSVRVRLSEVPPNGGADLIAGILERVESIRALVKGARDAQAETGATPVATDSAATVRSEWIQG
ncbi:MAG: hypothetical protein RLZZ436_850 [Planctomycetota bacterium]|jgi:hypothetical protein